MPEVVSHRLLLTLRTPDSSRLRIQSLSYRPPGLPGKDYFRTTVFFSRQLCNLACRYLIAWMVSTISRRECIHQTTLIVTLRQISVRSCSDCFTVGERKLCGSMTSALTTDSKVCDRALIFSQRSSLQCPHIAGQS